MWGLFNSQIKRRAAGMHLAYPDILMVVASDSQRGKVC